MQVKNLHQEIELLKEQVESEQLKLSRLEELSKQEFPALGNFPPVNPENKYNQWTISRYKGSFPLSWVGEEASIVSGDPVIEGGEILNLSKEENVELLLCYRSSTRNKTQILLLTISPDWDMLRSREEKKRKAEAYNQFAWMLKPLSFPGDKTSVMMEVAKELDIPVVEVKR